ncbi:hypothetical protein [Glycomyces paridis]|uniref:Uncharacterized protein n=1 Tax=Glycomyces paridis TaxID=2126555 RepID=A0A4V4HNX2_9ACTN|nr:hypothetical protein [Glycomyces paridis]THV27686.1 hypothetical protein E9998_14975 [Glycomyces paridis]
MNPADEIELAAALAVAVQRSALLPQEEQAALLDRYRRQRERVLRTGTAQDLRRLTEIDEATGPTRGPVSRTLRSRLVRP